MIKDILRKYLTPKMKMRLSFLTKETLRIAKNRKKISCFYPYKFIGYKNRHTFFGYFDISPYNSKGDMVFMVLDDNQQFADIILYNTITNEEINILHTYAWNWQQGCRLRWLPGSDDEIIFNDYDEGEYKSRIYNVKTKKERQISYPLYDVNKNGQTGLSLNFSRLGVKRPGYGYTCMPYVEKTELLSEEGIDLIDIKNNTSKRIVTYKMIEDSLGLNLKDFSNNYINHISYSPSSDKFLFFWLTVVNENEFHKANLLVYDINKKTIQPIETDYIVSHYLWTDDEHILCTVYDNDGKWHYILYGLDGSKKYMFPEINFDSHPTKIDEEWILADSYPDLDGYQYLFKCNLVTGEVKKIMELFSKPVPTAELRTDLHPRYHAAQKQACIDCNINGVRELCLINIDEI